MSVSTSSSGVITRSPISISWRVVFAGVFFALASAWIMYLFGGALGFSLINPYAQDPTSGLSYSAAAWILLTWLVSLFLGGLIVGRLSEHADRSSGIAHGILVWSVCIVLTILTGVMGVTTLLQSGGELIKSSAAAAAMYNSGNNKSLDTSPQGINTLALESDIKQEISRIVSRTPEGQTVVNSQNLQQSINQLSNDKLMQVAAYLLLGNTDAAKNQLALNSNLSSNDIDKIMNNLTDKVTQYKQNIKDYADDVSGYIAAVLWVVLISNLLSLLAAVAGSWLGIYTVSRVYGHKIY
jgi:hypothetical protein